VARDLFARPENGFRESKKSTLVFPYFAQWFVDGFLVGDSVDRRRNLSNHQIDLSQLYGLHAEVTDLIRERRGGRLKSQQIDGKGEYAPFLYDADGRLKPEYSVKRTGYRGFADIGPSQLFVEQSEGDVDAALLDRPLRFAHTFPDGTVIPRHLVLNEIPRRQRLFEWEGDPAKVKHVFAIANDRGNSTIAFTIMSTLMLREHNRIAGILDKQYGWDDERTFQTTRNILTVILLKIVVEEYINHIAPYHFKFFVDPPRFFKPQPWKWQNWMTTEFQLLYRWHPMIPDKLVLGSRTIDSEESLWNPSLLVEEGLTMMFQYAARQPAGEIGSRNTWHWLVEQAEVPSIKMGRLCRLARYNDYREYCQVPRVTSFDQITGNEDVQQALAKHYGSVDNIEYFTGLFCEDVRENSALAPLIGVMVAADAFSQALPNPLLQKRIWNKDTFSPRGWDIIHEETHTIESIVKRNSPELTSTERDALSITMTRKDWRRI
jgi:prostaglandin-endoperoxide synthase 2